MFGVPDERLGEAPAAVIWCEKEQVSDADLRDFLGQRLAAFKLPSYIWFTEAPLPKLGTGKIDKVSLRAHYRAKAAAA